MQNDLQPSEAEAEDVTGRGKDSVGAVAFSTLQVVAVHAMTGLDVADYRLDGGPRRAILGLDTTHGDRLFISLLGSAYIHLAWLAFVGPSLWAALAVSIVFAVVVFRWV